MSEGKKEIIYTGDCIEILKSIQAGYGFKPVKNPYPQNTKAHNAYNRGLKDAGILVEE